MCGKIEMVSHFRNKAFRSQGSVALREGEELSITERNNVNDRTLMLGATTRRLMTAVVRMGGCVGCNFKARCFRLPRNPAGHSVNPESVRDSSRGMWPTNVVVKGVQGPQLLMRSLRNIGAGNVHPSRNEAELVSMTRPPM